MYFIALLPGLILRRSLLLAADSAEVVIEGACWGDAALEVFVRSVPHRRRLPRKT